MENLAGKNEFYVKAAAVGLFDNAVVEKEIDDMLASDKIPQSVKDATTGSRYEKASALWDVWIKAKNSSSEETGSTSGALDTQTGNTPARTGSRNTVKYDKDYKVAEVLPAEVQEALNEVYTIKDLEAQVALAKKTSIDTIIVKQRTISQLVNEKFVSPTAIVTKEDVNKLAEKWAKEGNEKFATPKDKAKFEAFAALVNKDVKLYLTDVRKFGSKVGVVIRTLGDKGVQPLQALPKDEFTEYLAIKLPFIIEPGKNGIGAEAKVVSPKGRGTDASENVGKAAPKYKFSFTGDKEARKLKENITYLYVPTDVAGKCEMEERKYATVAEEYWFKVKDGDKEKTIKPKVKIKTPILKMGTYEGLDFKSVFVDESAKGKLPEVGTASMDEFLQRKRNILAGYQSKDIPIKTAKFRDEIANLLRPVADKAHEAENKAKDALSSAI